jgi:hypothetical protein
MSKVKREVTADQYYTQHLEGVGAGYRNNPATQRVALITRMYQRILTELAVNRFKWEGMPDSVDIRFLELTLFARALSVFYDDRDYGYLALRGGSTGYLNMLNNPVSFTVVGNHFISKIIKATECVPIWANYMRMPDLDIVSVYSQRLADMDRTVEINALNARNTKVIVTSENTKLSAVNFNRQIDEGQNGVQIAASGMPMQDMLSSVQVVDLGIDTDAIVNLHIVRTREWNECMGLLGIDNANQDKKERLVAAEVGANDEQTNMMKYVNLNARKMACEQINKMFPQLNVSVEYNTEVDKQAAAITDGTPSNEVDTSIGGKE